jgi:hypothetical protein
MLYENAKFARRILIINKDPKNAIAQTLDYINSVDLQIIPNMIKERESEICAKIYELSEIKGTLPFEIDLDFLALLGLMKSQVLSAEKDVQTLLKYLELSPGILKAFNQFYQMEMKIKDLHEWAATLKTLEQDPNQVCPDICIGPNTIRDHSVKGTTEDKRALFTDQGILQSYIRCNASQDHTYTFDELCRLHQLIAWLEHQKSIAEADAQDWFARWVDLGKQNPGKLCQFLFARAVKVKALCSLGCTDRLRNFKWASSSY